MGSPLNPALLVNGVNPPAISTPADDLALAQRLQQIRQQGQLAPLQVAQAQQNVQQTDLANQAEITKQRQQAEDEASDKLVQQEFSNQNGDWQKTRAAVLDKVPTRVIQKHDATFLQYERGVSAMRGDDRKQLIDDSTRYGQELEGVIETPEEQRQAAWEGTVQRAEQNGAVPPGRLPKQVPDINTLKSLQAATSFAKQAAQLADTRAQEDQRKATAAKSQQIEGQKAEVESKERFVSTLVAKGDELTQADYDAELQKLPANVRGQFPKLLENPKTGRTREQTLDQINRSLVNGNQRLTANIRATAKTTPIQVALDQARAENPNGDEDQVLARANEIYANTQRNAKVPVGAPAQDKKATAAALKGYNDAAKAEETGYYNLQRYNDAIGSGGTFLQENARGGLTSSPMQKYAASAVDKNAGGDAEEATKAASAKAIEDMKSRADALRDKIKASIRQKYEYANRLGQPLDVPVETALDAIERGKYKASAKAVAPPAAPAPAPVAASPAQPVPATPPPTSKAPAQTPAPATQKTFPRSKIAAFGSAQKKPLGPADAENWLKSQGYTISNE